MKSITHKIILLAISVSLIMGISIGLLIHIMINRMSETNLQQQAQIMYQDYDLLVRSEVETVVSMLAALNRRVEAGELTISRAKETGANLVREMRYNTEGYFWVDTKEGVNVVLLGRETEGKSRIDAQDIKGKYLIREIISNALKEGGGYTDYWFPKKEGGQALKKRSYSAYFEPFNWVVGTGNYIDQIEADVAAAEILNQKAIRNLIITILALIALIVLLTSAAAILIGRHISNPLKQLEKDVEMISQGDLTVDIKTEHKDEVGRLSVSLSFMAHKLKEIIKNINSGAENVVWASRELNHTAESISNNVNQGATSTEEVSSSMEQMLANVSQNLQNAVETEKIAAATTEKVLHVHHTFEETVKALNEIASKIMIVNEIAERTDLLAINAAIEAARAGLQGRGFAVVATEVRKLAERSRISAIEIEQLSNKLVTSANNSFTMLEEVVPGIQKNENLMKEMKLANNELNTGIEQINNAIQQLVDVTQADAAIAEELASNSTALEAQSSELKNSISFFKLKKTTDNEL